MLGWKGLSVRKRTCTRSQQARIGRGCRRDHRTALAPPVLAVAVSGPPLVAMGQVPAHRRR